METNSNNKKKKGTKMKKIIILLVLAVTYTVNATSENVSDEKFIQAILLTEDWRGKIGKYGEKGPYQILPNVIKDIETYDGIRYSMKDCLDIDISKEIFARYINIWVRRTNAPRTYETYAKIWNGGPWGWKSSKKTKKANINLNRYWRKVKSHMKEI
jgi:hypothetical protein